VAENLARAYRGDRAVAAIIVRDGEIIGEGQNTIYTDLDPSAHAEVAAIRRAGAKLKTLDRSGSTRYSTREPCPDRRASMRRTRSRVRCMSRSGRHLRFVPRRRNAFVSRARRLGISDRKLLLQCVILYRFASAGNAGC
jgi:hypothetical protein